MIDLNWQEVAAVLAALNQVNRTPAQEALRASLQEAYDNAAEEYWSEKWAG